MKKSLQNNLHSFFTQYQILTFKKGAIIIRAEDKPPGVFYVKTGYIKLYFLIAEGREIILNIFKPESFFPMTWALADIPNSYYFQSMTEVTVYRAPKEKVVEFITKNPEVLLDLTTRILVGLGGLLTDIGYFFSGNAYRRVLAAITLSAKRFGQKNKKGVVITLPLTHQDIANLSGLTRETVSVEMAKLGKKKITSYENHCLVISDLEGLEKELYLSGIETSLSSTL